MVEARMSRYFNDFSDMDSGEDLEHYGVLGMKWGIRKYQNPDGTLTAAGKKQYSTAGKYKKRAIIDKQLTARTEYDMQKAAKDNPEHKDIGTSKSSKEIIKIYNETKSGQSYTESQIQRYGDALLSDVGQEINKETRYAARQFISETYADDIDTLYDYYRGYE